MIDNLGTGESPHNNRTNVRERWCLMATTPVVSATEKAQEQKAAIETQILRVHATPEQMAVYMSLKRSKSLDEMAAAGFNQQLKSAVSSELTTARTAHSKAVQYGKTEAAGVIMAEIQKLQAQLNKLS